MKRVAVFLEVFLLVSMMLMCVMIIMAGRGDVPFIFGYRVLRVVTDSMEPTIKSETCIVIEQVEQEELEVGDIITFISESPLIKGFMNTHRIHEIVTDEDIGEERYVTIGDETTIPDPYEVSYDQVVGRYVRELPYGELLYRAIEFVMDQFNYFIIVMLPLFMCCMSYVKQLFKALFSKEEEEEEAEEQQQSGIPDLIITDLEKEDVHEEGRCN